MADQSATIAFLADPATHGGHRVSVIETHGAVVFLAGKRAYKLKRAVRFAYMDFSTLERRHLACEAELRINRRTAPGLYRDIVPIRAKRDGGFTLGGASGRIIDWVVVMRRFDRRALLSQVAERGGLDVELMRGLAETIARFHSAADVRRSGGGIAGHREVARVVLSEIDRHHAVFAEKPRQDLRRLTDAMLDAQAPTLERRRKAGRVRHGHGDLHLRNICLLDGTPTLFDGLEFDEDLAVSDVLYDLAYLLMDLDQQGQRALANAVLNRYLELQGDQDGLGLLPLFLSQRAAIRAHVLASTAAAAEQRQTALRREANHYLDLALRYAKPAAARLIAIGGLSGTGKSTIARAVAPKIGPAPGAVILRSDVIRKSLCGVGELERLTTAYDAKTTRAVYGELNRLAALILQAGHGVIADATFLDPAQRKAIEKTAPSGTAFTGIWLAAPKGTLLARVAGRAGDASDATVETVRSQAQLPVSDIGWAKVSAAGTPAQTVQKMRSRLTMRAAARPATRR